MKKLSRREFLHLTAVTASGAILAACTQPTEPEEAPEGEGGPEDVPAAPEQVTIRYHVRTGSQGDYYQEQADAFAEAQDGITVELEMTPGAEYEQQLTTLVAGGELGDGFWSAPFVVFYPFSARDICLDMYPLAEADGYDLDVFFNAAIEQLTWEGKLTGWPMGAHPGWTSMFTNLDAWEEAGAEQPQWEWTYDDQWFDAVEAVTLDEDGDGNADRYGFQFNTYAQGPYTFIKSWGGDWIDPSDLRTCTIDSDESVAALMFLHDLMYEHGISPKPGAVVDNMWHNGLAASWAHGIWHVSTARETVQDNFAWQVFPMPAGPGGRGSFVGIDTMCINSASEHPEAVFEWHKWMTTQEAGLEQVEWGFTPPVRHDAWQEPALADDENFGPTLQWMEVATPTTFPGNARVNEFVQAINSGLEAFFLEENDPVAVIEDMAASVQEVLDKPVL